jgi:hypothetical protein
MEDLDAAGAVQGEPAVDCDPIVVPEDHGAQDRVYRVVRGLDAQEEASAPPVAI